MFEVAVQNTIALECHVCSTIILKVVIAVSMTASGSFFLK